MVGYNRIQEERSDDSEAKPRWREAPVPWARAWSLWLVDQNDLRISLYVTDDAIANFYVT